MTPSISGAIRIVKHPPHHRINPCRQFEVYGIGSADSTLAPEIAAATGWPLATAVQAQVLSWTMAVFPYQLPPLLPPAALVRVMIAMTATAWIAILPLTWAWWSLLGLFG